MSQDEGTVTSLEEFKQLLLSKLPEKLGQNTVYMQGYDAALSEVERIINEL